MRKSDELEKIIKYSFKNKSFLEVALTHSSYANEAKRFGKSVHNNERLEFLGDAVLELTSSQFLFNSFPDYPEGKLTKLRASIVCEQTLAMCAREISLGEFIKLGKGEERTGGRKRDSITSDALEAVIGAIYLDGGFDPACRFVYGYIMNDIEHKQLYVDCKTNLQEIVQRDYPEQELIYELIAEEGPDHDKQFTVVVKIGDKVLGTGTARTKKNAEQHAAFEAVSKMQNN